MVKIMLIEQDPSLAWLYQEELEEAGFRVNVQASLEKALYAQRSNPADILLTDLSTVGENLDVWLPRLRSCYSGPLVLIGEQRCRLPQGEILPRVPKTSDLSRLLEYVRGQALKVMWSQATVGSC